MNNREWKKYIQRGFVLLQMMLVFAVLYPMSVHARTPRTVRVAFFPMEGFHTYSEADGYGGLDVTYLEELCGYTGWNLKYVKCDSWNEALEKLKAKEVDLVGSAQHSKERNKIYDYASLSSGYTFGCLFVKEESPLAFEDFEHMKDASFGVVKSYVRKKDCLLYLSRNGITQPRLKEYDTTQQLQDALESGEIDVGIHSMTEVRERQSLVGKFAYSPYYYITWKGNVTLLDELNLAIEEIKRTDPGLEQELASKYYGEKREKFAAEELQLINRRDTVKIGFYKDTTPLAYINDKGEYDGIYIQILKAVSERSGVSIEFYPIDQDNYWKKLLLNGDIDFYVGANNMKLTQDEYISLTNSFMSYDAVIVSQNDFALTDKEVTVALTKGRTYWANSLDMDAKIIYCNSAKDCLQLVKSGEADITLLNTIEYNYQSKNEQFSDLIEWENYRYQAGTILAASIDVDPVLLSVMNKALRFVSVGERQDIINQYMNISYENYELVDYLYQSKDVIAVAVVVLALLLIFVYIVSHMRKRSYVMLEKKNGELQTAIQEAERANQAKTEFLSHMSHDIRTPINGIMGMLNIAEKSPEDPERQADCRAKIKLSAEHLLSLINDVLDISKLESANVEFVRETFNLKELLRNCLVIVGGQATEREVDLVSDFTEPEQLPHEYFVGSPLHIKQILVNIAGNAVKYNKPMGSVNFRCYEISEEDGIAQICFEISDTGIGMDPAYLKHIFEPFTQEKGGARTIYEGTGLGMTITKNLIDKMGGTIQVESELDIGSIFTVVLPLEIAAPPETRKETREVKPVEVVEKQVLLVEDNELNQEVAQFMLTEWGVKVTVAENGQEAVDLFCNAEPYTFQLIFMDIMMPVMDGYEATRAIRSLDRPDAAEVPIIAMTANAFAEDVKKAKEAGMNEHMAKPLDPALVNHVMARWLGIEKEL